MGRKPCCPKVGLNKGAWSVQEDELLNNYIKLHGEGKWREVPQRAGLKRYGKSCRLRWVNYLRPDIKRGHISVEEEDLIIRLHKLLGNRWSLIAGRLPGRTDNEIKNYWNTKLRKKVDGNTSINNEDCRTQSDCFNKLDEVKKKYCKQNHDGVVRTKAVRCTKVININPDHAKVININPDHPQQDNDYHTSKDNTVNPTATELHHPSSPMLQEQIDDSSMDLKNLDLLLAQANEINSISWCLDFPVLAHEVLMDDADNWRPYAYAPFHPNDANLELNSFAGFLNSDASFPK